MRLTRRQGPLLAMTRRDNGPAAGDPDGGDKEPRPTTNLTVPTTARVPPGTKKILETGTWVIGQACQRYPTGCPRGFGDQVVDTANLITDVAEGAYSLARTLPPIPSNTSRRN